MQNMSHREYMMRVAWMDRQWNEAAPEHYYLAQIAMLIHQSFRKKSGKKYGLTDFLMRFVSKGKKTQMVARTKEEATAVRKQAWGAVLGGAKARVIKRPPLQNPPNE